MKAIGALSLLSAAAANAATTYDYVIGAFEIK
jgi:hypothetical protein